MTDHGTSARQGAGGWDEVVGSGNLWKAEPTVDLAQGRERKVQTSPGVWPELLKGWG